MRRSPAAAVVLAWALAGCSAGPAASGLPSAAPSSHSPSGAAGSSPGPRSRPARPAHVVARLLRWRTPVPVSRAALAVRPPGTLLLAGGLVGGTSTTRVSALDTGTGRSRPAGRLAVPTHDGAVLTVHGHSFVVGGGSASSIDLVQELAPPGRAARVVAHLPRPRSDDVGVRSGDVGFVVGGYDGSAADRSVLATRDGRTYRPVARLAVAVRYAAVAARGGDLFVLGGEAVGGPHDGVPVDLIQRVDVRRHRTAVVGHLPAPVQDAVAFRLGATLYLAGGRASSVSSARATRAVYALDTAGNAVHKVARLPRPVADAGVAVLGRTAWLVGGESAGRTLDLVQTVTWGTP
jgi:hypothetical protein